MNFLKVNLWGEELGRLVWNPSRNTTYFIFNPEKSDRPDVAPLIRPVSGSDPSLPVYGDSRRIYQGLPPFIADSLPDAWGNELFDRWVKQNKIQRNKITPLFKLMFIGKRGMGALEYEPAAHELEHLQTVNINDLYKMSLEVREEREAVALHPLEKITMKALLAVGTSAGGRQMKAIVAIDPITGQVRSGQISGLTGFDYYIIKFEDAQVPTTEIEMAFYEMAVDCGIDMEECRAIEIEGIPHFMTRRFDRKNGEKIHLQTLAAINPEASSYEDLMDTCRELRLTDAEISQIFRRLVFNVLVNNTDDHNKNFSFLLEKGGKWRLAPAYDLTFIFNLSANGPETFRCMSLYGKTEGITNEDLLEFALENSIRNASAIIADVAKAAAKFPELAEKYKIPDPWKHIIHKTLLQNLADFGFAELTAPDSEIIDSIGREFREISLSINSKRYYHVSAIINGKPAKRIINPKSELFAELQKYELGNLPTDETVRLIESVFPPEEYRQ